MSTPIPKKEISYWRQATSLIGGTLPMLGVNLAVYAVYFLVTTLWLLFWGGLGILIAKLVPIVGFIFIFIGLGAGGWLAKFVRRYILYLVKGAHIAAMTEMMMGRTVPAGFGQLAYGRAIVEKNFKDVSLLFGLDTLINGTVKAITGKIASIASWLPLPGDFRKIIRVVEHIVNRSLSYIDEAILSYAIARNEENVWNSARQGIVLYGQSYKRILMTSAKIYLGGRVFAFLLFVFFLLPAGAVIWGLGTLGFDNPLMQLVIIILAAVAGQLVYLALYEPFALAYVMVAYHNEIAGKVPDPEWDQRLQNLSSSFKELVGKAQEKIAGTSAPAAAFAPQAPAPQPAYPPAGQQPPAAGPSWPHGDPPHGQG
jgi:hypothetical protein